LDDPPKVSLDRDGRKLTLLSDYRFSDPEARIWLAKEGTKVDGASIPQWLWSIVGGPLEGTYRNSSIIHDYYCDTKERSWQETHRVFYYGMRAAGVSDLRAKIMYYAVYTYGPRWAARTSHRTRPIYRGGTRIDRISTLTTIRTEKIKEGDRQKKDVGAFERELETGKAISLDEIERRAGGGTDVFVEVAHRGQAQDVS
jgi:hypothetical protein